MLNQPNYDRFALLAANGGLAEAGAPVPIFRAGCGGLMDADNGFGLLVGAALSGQFLSNFLRSHEGPTFRVDLRRSA